MYTSPILLPLLADLLESFGAQDKLGGFVSTNGRRFYRCPIPEDRAVTVQLVKHLKAPRRNLSWKKGSIEVVGFLPGRPLRWSIVSSTLTSKVDGKDVVTTEHVSNADDEEMEATEKEENEPQPIKADVVVKSKDDATKEKPEADAMETS